MSASATATARCCSHCRTTTHDRKKCLVLETERLARIDAQKQEQLRQEATLLAERDARSAAFAAKPIQEQLLELFNSVDELRTMLDTVKEIQTTVSYLEDVSKNLRRSKRGAEEDAEL